MHQDKLQINKARCSTVPSTARGGCWCVMETAMEAGGRLAASSTWLKQCHVGGAGKHCLEQELLLGRAGMTGLPCQAPACNPQCR